MDPAVIELLAPMLVAVVLILTVGGVILLRPLSKRIGDLLEAMTDERKNPSLQEELHHIRGHLDTLGSRLSLLEERQDFQEKLLGASERTALPRTPGGGSDG